MCTRLAPAAIDLRHPHLLSMGNIEEASKEKLRPGYAEGRHQHWREIKNARRSCMEQFTTDMAKLGEITGKTLVLYSKFGRTPVLPCGHGDKNEEHPHKVPLTYF